MSEFNDVIGDRDLCAWQPVKGVTWIQARDPQHARRLSRRRDGRLVGRGVAGGYLRVFEFVRPLSWAARLIRRYTVSGAVTNEALPRLSSTQEQFCDARGPTNHE